MRHGPDTLMAIPVASLCPTGIGLRNQTAGHLQVVEHGCIVGQLHDAPEFRRHHAPALLVLPAPEPAGPTYVFQRDALQFDVWAEVVIGDAALSAHGTSGKCGRRHQ